MANIQHTPRPNSDTRLPPRRESASRQPPPRIAETRAALHGVVSSPLHKEEEQDHGIRTCNIILSAQADIPAVLECALANLEGLTAPREAWVGLLRSLCIRPWCTYRDPAAGDMDAAAQAIVESSQNEEGERATAQVTDGWVQFRTPGGARVTLSPVAGGVDLAIDFGRESWYLAVLVLADVFRHIPGVAPLLAKAAQEAAAALDRDGIDDMAA